MRIFANNASTYCHIDQLFALICLDVRGKWLACYRNQGRQDDDLSPKNGTDGGGNADGCPPNDARADDWGL